LTTSLLIESNQSDPHAFTKKIGRVERQDIRNIPITIIEYYSLSKEREREYI